MNQSLKISADRKKNLVKKVTKSRFQKIKVFFFNTMKSLQELDNQSQKNKK